MILNPAENPKQSLTLLNETQLTQLDRWLRNQNIALAEIVEFCAKHFHIITDIKALQRHQKRRGQKSNFCTLETAVKQADQVLVEVRTPSDPRLAKILDEIRNLTLAKAIEKKAEDLKLIGDFTKILISAQRVEDARDKWEFNAAEACLQHAIHIKGVEENSMLDDQQRVVEIRHLLFGPVLPQ